MAKLLLKFEAAVLKELVVGSQPVTIGRLPDNDIQVDNLAVSSHHARIYREGTQLFVEDLNSTNGTFLNNQRITKAALKDGDKVLVGKHHIEIQETGAAVPEAATPGAPKKAAPKIEETVMLDSKRRKELLQQAMADATAAPKPAAPSLGAAPGSPVAPAAPAAPRVRVPTLVVLSGKTDQKEYLLAGKLIVIGKSEMATVRVLGFFAQLFAPKVAAQISKRDDGYYILKADHTPKVNGTPIPSPTKLNDGDMIEVSGLKLNFVYRD